jgi:hypothetical protein
MTFRNILISLLTFAGLALLSQNAAVVAGTSNDGDNGQGQQIQLSDLAGTTAETGRGSIVECTDSTGSPVACSTTGAVAHSFTYVAVGPVIRDEEGNACGSFTQTLANVPPDKTPPIVSQFQVGAKTTDYDPETANGDCSFTSYTGAKCAGAIATGGTVIGTGTCHFTASEGGRRIDYILTTLPGVGAFSISGFDHRE